MGAATNHYLLTRSLAASICLLYCSITPSFARDEPILVTKEIKIGSVDPLTYSIRISAENDDILLKWTKERVPTLEEQQADLRNPVYREAGHIPKRWDHKSIFFEKSHLPRVERAFSKFSEWAEVAAKENIKDHKKVIEDINDEPHKTLGLRLTFVFAAPMGVLPTMLRVQRGEDDYRWEGFTTQDVAHFQVLLKRLPEMEEEAKRKRAEATKKKSASAVEKERIDMLLK